MIFDVADIGSPVGPLTLAAHDQQLCVLTFRDRWPKTRKSLERRFGTVEERESSDPAGAATRLRRYFAGDLGALDDVRVDPTGTPFQHSVWNALRATRPGQTLSYRDLARTIGAPTAVRAVGAANGANPIAIIIPCHRIIGSDGTLTGYAGGLERKRWLLAHEGAR